MPQISLRKMNPEIEKRTLDVFVAVLLNSRASLNPSSFIDLFLTPTEKIMLAKRVAIAILIKRGYSYDLIKSCLKVSQSTISGIVNQLKISPPKDQIAIDKAILSRDIQKVLSDFEYGLGSLLPPKGGDWSTWRKNLEKDKRLSEIPL
jgi:uncharacterized protein YerC